jgi:putative ABC transport system permease protein
MSVAPAVSWPLAVALVALLAIAVTAARHGRIGIGRDLVVATARAVAQLTAVAFVIGVVLDHRWASLLFAAVMATVAVATACGRTETYRSWPWVATAIAGGVAPVLTIVFAVHAVAFTPPAIVAIAGIVIGGAMTAHTLTTRRAFDTIRSDLGQIEAALALGLDRPAAIELVINRHAREAVLPAIDQTRTVGLVTLPGAFVGVLLGGGSAADAAAAQVLVLVGLLAAETLVVVLAHRLIAHGRILPADLAARLPPR